MLIFYSQVTLLLGCNRGKCAYNKTWGWELAGGVVGAGSYFDGGVVCRFQREMKEIHLHLAFYRVSGAAVSLRSHGHYSHIVTHD